MRDYADIYPRWIQGKRTVLRFVIPKAEESLGFADQHNAPPLTISKNSPITILSFMNDWYKWYHREVIKPLHIHTGLIECFPREAKA